MEHLKTPKVETPTSDWEEQEGPTTADAKAGAMFPLTLVDEMTEHCDKITQLVGHPSYRAFISASKDGSVIIWNDINQYDMNSSSWAPAVKWMAHNNLLTESSHCKEVTDVNIGLTSHCITSSLDRSVILWDLIEGRVSRKLSEIGSSGIQSVSISCDNTMVATGSLDGSIRLLDLRLPHENLSKCQMTFENAHVDSVHRVRLNPVVNNNLLLSCGGPQLKLWDIRLSTSLGLFRGVDADLDRWTGVSDITTRRTNILEYAQDGDHFVCGGGCQSINIWESNQPTGRLKFKTEISPVVSCTRFSPDCINLAVAKGNKVMLYNMKSRLHIATAQFQSLTATTVNATSVAWSYGNDNATLIVGMEDGSISIFEFNGSQCPGIL